MACRTRRRYPTELDAKLALASTQYPSRRARSRDEIRYYLCPYCRNYHLTSAPLHRQDGGDDSATSPTSGPSK